MKECCANCGHCIYSKDYVNPYQCKYGKQYKRMNAEEAGNKKCEMWTMEIWKKGGKE